jgi:hypothetical protein
MLVDTKTIHTKLFGYLRHRTTGVVMPNVYVKNSPWESDMICVTPAFYYSEYEIKVSIADYQNDFRKRVRRWSKTAKLKHELYATSTDDVDEFRIGKRPIPRPKRFYFVVPAGMLDHQEVPLHCGILEFSNDFGYWKIKEKRSAPPLKNATKLSTDAVFEIAAKASMRLCYQAAITTQNDGAGVQSAGEDLN